MADIPIMIEQEKGFEEGIELGMVPYSQIICEDRIREDYGEINELVESFRKDGIIQPIAVKRVGPDEYKLLAGGRRFMAAGAIGAKHMPCRIYTRDLTELEMRFIELAENIYRKDLHFSERVKLDKKIMTLMEEMYGKKESTASDAPGVSIRDVATRLGRSVSGFAENLQMADIIEKMPEIGNLPTMDDARKLIKEIHKDLLREDAVRKIEKSRATPLDEQLSNLSESFTVNDFFVGIASVADSSVKIIELDPPYAINLPGIKQQENPAFDLDRYNEISVKEYPTFIDKVLAQCYRVLADGGWLIQWFGPDPWFEVIYQALVRHGFITFRIPGVWVKTNGTGQTHNPELRMGSNYELFYYARKGTAEIKKKGRPNTFLFDVVPNQRKIHPTERPVELIQEILTVFGEPGDQVLVPFLGSGNTLLAASNLAMPATGFELGKQLKDDFTLRVYESKPGLYKSYKGN